MRNQQNTFFMTQLEENRWIIDVRDEKKMRKMQGNEIEIAF